MMQLATHLFPSSAVFATTITLHSEEINVVECPLYKMYDQEYDKVAFLH